MREKSSENVMEGVIYDLLVSFSGFHFLCDSHGIGGFMKCPCMGCNNRQVLCHSNCDSYKKWKEYQTEIYRREYAERLVTLQLTDMRKDRYQGKHVAQPLKQNKKW